MKTHLKLMLGKLIYNCSGICKTFAVINLSYLIQDHSLTEQEAIECVQLICSELPLKSSEFDEMLLAHFGDLPVQQVEQFESVESVENEIPVWVTETIPLSAYEVESFDTVKSQPLQPLQKLAKRLGQVRRFNCFYKDDIHAIFSNLSDSSARAFKYRLWQREIILINSIVELGSVYGCSVH
jgi:hypothetical protein